MNETRLVEMILQLLWFHNLVAWRQNLGGVLYTKDGETKLKRNPMKGFPDIGGLCPSGRLFAIEAKIGRNKTSPEQDHWIARLRKSNALVYVVYTFDEAKALVHTLKVS